MSRNARRGRPPNRVYPVPYVISRRPPGGGLGLQDPSYVADTPHDLWLAMQAGQQFPSTRSAEELEAWLQEGPGPAELLELDILERRRYDGGGRLLAKWILEHYGRHPQDVRLPEVVKRELLKQHPEMPQLGLSTAQWVWAAAAANRIRDAHLEDD